MLRKVGMISLSLLAVVAMQSVIWTPSTADAARRRYSRSRSSGASQRAAISSALQAAQAQVAVAQQVQAAAAQRAAVAEAKAGSAQSQVNDASGSLSTSKSEATDAAKKLHEIEMALEEAQPDDSEFGRVLALLDETEEAMDLAEDRVLGSADYKAKYQAALNSANKAQLLPKVRSEALAGDEEYQQAKKNFELAKTKYAQLAMALYSSNQQWLDAAEASRDARSAEAKNYRSLSNGLLSKASANADLREANRTGNAAAAVVQQGQAAIQNLQSQLQRVGGNRSSGSSGSKNNNNTKKKK